MSKKIFLDCRCISRSQIVTHFLKISEVIHEFLLAQYSAGKRSILRPLKQRGITVFSITNNFRLSVPDIFEQLCVPMTFLNQIKLHIYNIGICQSSSIKQVSFICIVNIIWSKLAKQLRKYCRFLFFSTRKIHTTLPIRFLEMNVYISTLITTLFVWNPVLYLPLFNSI